MPRITKYLAIFIRISRTTRIRRRTNFSDGDPATRPRAIVGAFHSQSKRRFRPTYIGDIISRAAATIRKNSTRCGRGERRAEWRRGRVASSSNGCDSVMRVYLFYVTREQSSIVNDAQRTLNFSTYVLICGLTKLAHVLPGHFLCRVQSFDEKPKWTTSFTITSSSYL